MEIPSLYRELEFGNLENALKSVHPGWDFSFGDLFVDILEGRGKEAFLELFSDQKHQLLSEIEGMKTIIVTIVIVVLLSAVFHAFRDAFRNPQIADISFYINYLILVIVCIGVFQQMLLVGEETLNSIEKFMRIFFPTYFMTVGAAAGSLTAMGYYPLACLLIYGVEWLLKFFLLPFISCYMLFVIMNGIWEEERLELLLKLWKKGIGGLLRMVLGLLTGASLLQSLVTPLIDRAKDEVMYKAVESIPGVGDLAGGISRIWVSSAVLIKNTAGVASCLLLLGLCLLPLLKLAFTACLLKGMAAVLGIVGEKRMIHCTDHVGDGVWMLFVTCFYAIVLFLVLIAITAFATNGGL